MKEWGHDELMYDLADHLDRPERMLWTDMQLGPSGSARPDVYTMAKSYAKPRPMVYEIKVSVSDFRSDVTSGKWQKYLEFSSGVYFACPAKMINKTDVPATCGLIIRSDKGWRSVKAPTLQVVDLDWFVMMKLLIDGVTRHTPERRIKYFTNFIQRKEAAKILGQDVADAVQGLQKVRAKQDRLQKEIDAKLNYAQEDASRIRANATETADRCKADAVESMSELYEILGVEPGTMGWKLRDKLAALKKELSKDEQIIAIHRFIESTERLLRTAKETIRSE